MDTKGWAGYRGLFTEDYQLDVLQAGSVDLIRDREGALRIATSQIEQPITAHQVHSPEIQFDGDEVKVFWTTQDRVCFPNGPSTTGYGHYTERYVHRNGDWQIAASKLTRLHIDVDSLPAQS